MSVAIIVATCGDEKWRRLAAERAVPSAFAEAAAGPSRSVHVSHYPDLTVAEARNRAADEVPRGCDWLCFLDADDELEPGYLDAMEDALTRHRILHAPVIEPRSSFDAPEALLVPLLRRIPPDHERTVQRIATGSGVSRESVGDVTPIASIPNQGRWPQVNECVIGTLVRRDLFERVGGFRDTTDDGTAISSIEDYDLWLRCFDAGARLVYTDAIYREHVSPAGRNLDQSPYDAIWEDHLRRIRAI